MVESRNWDLRAIEFGNQESRARFSLTSALMALLLFGLMQIGPKYHYWGFMHDLKKPEYPGFLDPNCRRDSRDGPPCEYNAKNSKYSVLLIGDSHAGHFSQAVVDAASLLGWKAIVWTRSHCHITFSKSKKAAINETCLEMNNLMLDWVRLNKPTAIFVSQYVYRDSDQVSLKSGLKQLSRLVKNITFIENTPVFPDEARFMVDLPLLMRPYKAPTTFPIEKMNYRDSQASTKLANWASLNDIGTLNLGGLFCSSENCKRYARGEWLYSDDDHLSEAGAALAIPQFMSILGRIQENMNFQQ